MTNIEIKAKCRNLPGAHQQTKQIGAIYQWETEQIDTYYQVAKGRLKLRENERGHAELIAYSRSNIAQAKPSDYLIYKPQNLEALRQVLESTLNRQVVVKKHRTLYLWENVRIHLDDVDSLGGFIEFEAIVDQTTNFNQAQDKVNKLLTCFGIADSDLIPFSYADLILQLTYGHNNSIRTITK